MPLPLTFNSNNVESVNVLKFGKVFLITFANDSQVVIKAESGLAAITDRTANRKKVDFAMQLSAKVGAGSNSRSMDAAEVQQIGRLRAKFPGEEADWAVALDPNFAAQTTWIMMEKESGLTSLEDVVYGTSKQAALMLLMELRRKPNMVQLGRILAVDLFLGNGDRFRINPGELEDSFQNMGNVFISKNQNKELTIRGLDPLDPSSSWAKLDQDLLVVSNGNIQSWPGLILKDNRRMKEIANRLATEITDALVGKCGMDDRQKSKWAVKRKDVGYITDGMKKGRDEIKLLCRARTAKNGGRSAPPAGLTSRMRAMGWVK
jgi:hypothetical protein